MKYLLALAVLFGAALAYGAPKVIGPVGRYQISCAGRGGTYATREFMCWRVDTATGEVVRAISE